MTHPYQHKFTADFGATWDHAARLTLGPIQVSHVLHALLTFTPPKGKPAGEEVPGHGIAPLANDKPYSYTICEEARSSSGVRLIKELASFVQPVAPGPSPELDAIIAQCLEGGRFVSCGLFWKAASSTGARIGAQMTLGDVLDKVGLSVEIIDVLQHASEPSWARKQPTQGGIVSSICANVTAQAAAGQLVPIQGRETEVGMLKELSVTPASKIMLVGDPGVGKTAIIHQLAIDMVSNKHAHGHILSISMSGLMTEGYWEGMLETKISGLVREIRDLAELNDQVYLVWEDLPALAGTEGDKGDRSGSGKLLNLLKEHASQLTMIATCDTVGYSNLLAFDRAVAEMFTTIRVEEPDAETMELIIEAFRDASDIEVMDEAIETVQSLAKLYFPETRAPRSILNLLVKSVAAARSNQGMPRALARAQSRKQHAVFNLQKSGQRKGWRRKNWQKKNMQARTDVQRATDELAKAEIAYQEIQRKRVIRDQCILKHDTILTQMEGGLDNDLVPVWRHYTLPKLEDTIRAITREEDLAGMATIVTSDLVAEMVSEQVSIPKEFLGISFGPANTRETALRLEQELKGQPEAIAAALDVMRRLTASRTSRRPIAALLATGPAGSGKSMLGRLLANLVMGDPSAYQRIDCANLDPESFRSILLGAAISYRGSALGGQLTTPVQQRLRRVFVIEDVEKFNGGEAACLFHFFELVLREGIILDARGHKADFTQSIFLFTASTGHGIVERQPEGTLSEATVAAVNDQLAAGFPASFRSRLNHTIIYRKLGVPEVVEILRHEADKLVKEFASVCRLVIEDEAVLAVARRFPVGDIGVRKHVLTLEEEVSNAIRSVDTWPGRRVHVVNGAEKLEGRVAIQLW